MLGYIFFTLWRLAEIVTLIPTLGMLVSPLPLCAPSPEACIDSTPGILRQHQPESEPTHPSVYPVSASYSNLAVILKYDADISILQDPLHRLHTRGRMGDRHSPPPQINQKINPICRLRRPLLHRRLHSRRLRTPRYR